VVLIDGEPAGCLYLHRGDTEILIVDVALLPAHHGKGVGSALKRRTQTALEAKREQCATAGLPRCLGYVDQIDVKMVPRRRGRS
jgi:GNAT superfamily N-acetyltransferase